MLSRDLRRQMRRLQLRARRAVEDLLGGAYRSVFKGSGIAFEEVREYQPGDDFRYLDVSVFQRFDKLLLRLYEEEEDLSIYFIVDASSSMGFLSRPNSSIACRMPARNVASSCSIRSTPTIANSASS